MRLHGNRHNLSQTSLSVFSHGCQNREIVLFNITANPTAIWLETAVRSNFGYIENLPSVMISDRDGIYGNWFGEFLKSCCEIELIRTPPRCPNCNSFIERWHRTYREEVLDHGIIFGSSISMFGNSDYYEFRDPGLNIRMVLWYLNS